jgi:hypothetical protein
MHMEILGTNLFYILLDLALYNLYQYTWKNLAEN